MDPKTMTSMDPKTMTAVDSFLIATGAKKVKEEGNGDGNGELGEVLSKRIHCDDCDIWCTGELCYDMHLKGKQHAKVVKANEFLGNKLASTNPNECILMKRMEQVEEPVIGLHYITEYQPLNDVITVNTVWFFCRMCKCKLSYATVVPHIIGIKHRLAYARKHHPDLVPDLTNTENKKQQTALAMVFTDKIASMEPRRPPRVQKEKKDTQGKIDMTLDKQKAEIKMKRQQKIAEGTVPTNKKSILQSQLKTIKGAKLGLQHIIEVQPPSGPTPSSMRYYCDLCDVTCDTSTIRTHITGIKHRKNYIDKNYPELHTNQEQNETGQANKSRIEEYSSDIEKKEQMGKIRVHVEKFSQESPSGGLKKFSQESPSGGLKRPLEESFHGQQERGAGGRGRGRGGFGRGGFGRGGMSSMESQVSSIIPRAPAAAPRTSGRAMGLAVSMDRLLQLLEATPISTEEEAELALELSNRLTQELLEFRKQSVPVHMFETAKRSSGLSDVPSGRFARLPKRMAMEPERMLPEPERMYNEEPSHSRYDAPSPYDTARAYSGAARPPYVGSRDPYSPDYQPPHKRAAYSDDFSRDSQPTNFSDISSALSQIANSENPRQYYY